MYYTTSYYKPDLKLYYRRIDAGDTSARARQLRQTRFCDGMYTMLYITSGRCDVFCDGKRFRICDNSLMLFDLKQQSSFDFLADSFCEYLLIQLHPSLITAVEDVNFTRPFSAAYRNCEPILLLENGSYRLKSAQLMLDNLILAVKASLSREHILPRINTVISDLCIYYDGKYFPETLETDSITVKVMDYIHRHCFEKITYETIGERFYISTCKINEILRGYTGTSLRKYLIKIRLDEAKHLLNTTSFDATTIGKMCGFGSYTAFFRAYKKAFGDLPSNRIRRK